MSTDKIYSQHGEQIQIELFFEERIGRFLDVGAFNGITYSNVYPLVLKGWRGVALEPAVIFANLKENYKDYPNIICEKIGLAEFDGEKLFYETNGNAISTTELKHKEMWEKVGTKYVESKIIVKTWQTIFKTFGYDFNFISLDVEGNSVDLFKLLPIELLPQLELICVEHDNRQDEVVLPGFEVYHLNCLNVLLRRTK